MELKYAADLKRHVDCPPLEARACNREAFRFVSETLGNPRNFLPVAKLNPSREFQAHKRCKSLGLSMFTTKEFAVQFFKYLQKANRNIHNTLGTHVGHAALTENDGLATDPESNGHFALFEASAIQWDGRFEIIEALV